MKKDLGFMGTIRRDVKIVKTGTKVKKAATDYVFPIALLIFAAAAYWLYDIPIPEKKKKKVSKAKTEVLKDSESQKIIWS